MNPHCQALVTLLGAGNVLLPGSTGYNESIVSYYAPQASAAQPVCFVTPKTAHDVSAIVRYLASDGDAPGFAVRGGGHMWVPGASSSAGGVTIDLRGLSSVELSGDHSSVSVGGGVTWDMIYNKLDPLGLSVAGGRVAGVGVGGLTLGGGISYFGPRYGWTCNQATSFEVVLADGSIVRASAHENRDLWKGLRGGANNFGIVTAMELVTFKQGPLWSALAISPTTILDDQAKICAELMAPDNYDEDASFITGWAFSSVAGGSVALNQLVHTKPNGTETPPFYANLLALPTIPNIGSPPTIASVSKVSEDAGAFNAKQASRYLMATTTFVPTEAMIRELYAAFDASLDSVRDLTGIMWAINIEPLPPQIYGHGADENALGLADRSGTLAVSILSPAWSDAKDDDRVYAAARALMDDVEARAKRLGVYDPYVYLGYAAPWQDAIASYGKESVAHLRALRARVDPGEVFTKRVAGGFKIPSSD